ncbi:hypothetical protein AHAS_Ahas01G0285500 [Arachis hypogaea]
MTQLFKSPTPSPPRPIYPLLRGRKIIEHNEQRIRGWAVDTSLDSQQTLVSYEGRPHLVLSREDLCTLRPRAWFNNSVCDGKSCYSTLFVAYALSIFMILQAGYVGCTLDVLRIQ